MDKSIPPAVRSSATYNILKKTSNLTFLDYHSHCDNCVFDYVQRSCSSLYRLLRFTNCPTYIALHYIARLLLDTKGYMLPRYRQHVAGNEQHVARQHVACYRQDVARPRSMLPGNTLPWCKRGFTDACDECMLQ